ncbi:uncharacterized protein LOC135400027 [Ornithodoros turicata]|uniref:uncharacterized protein LOC135400027 n=1 Tax=Ornithodoros turicata TaxID=34597 RepID=UPI003138A5BC
MGQNVKATGSTLSKLKWGRNRYANLHTYIDNTPLKQRPMSDKPVLCFMLDKVTRSTVFPEDGLCHFLFLEVRIDASKIAYTNGDELLQRFYANAENSSSTGYGLSIKADAVPAAYGSINGISGSLQELWSRNIRHFGVSDQKLVHDDTPSAYYEVSLLLGNVRSLQGQFKNYNAEPPSYIILSVIPPDRLGRTDEDLFFVEAVGNLIRHFSPDALVLTTVAFNALKEPCRVTGPTPWNDDTDPDKGYLMVRVLEAWRKASISQSVRLLISFTASGFAYTATATHPFVSTDGEGASCEQAAVAPRNDFCRINSTIKDNGTVLQYGIKDGVLYAFDTADTMEEKMCRAAVDYNFQGGYCMFSIENADSTNACDDDKYKGDLIIVHHLKDLAAKTFTSC